MNLNKIYEWLSVISIIIAILICVISYEHEGATWILIAYAVIAIIQIVQLIIVDKSNKNNK